MKRDKLFTLVLCFVLMLALAACSPKAPADAVAAGTAPAARTEETAAPATPAPTPAPTPEPTPTPEPEPTIFVSLNVEGWGSIACGEGETAPDPDGEESFRSAQIALIEPEICTLAALPDEGWKFIRWTKDGEDFSAEETITVEFSESAEYLAVFEEDDSWKLVLVNSTHPLPEDFTVTLKELRNDHHVDERIYPELQQMFDDARAEGIYPLINESFRTAERQQEIMDKYIANYETNGMSHDAAVAAAEKIVAIPGTSEHQLGLALDIIAENGDSTATWQWLKENCWRYGFILRYPADKTEITGISYEPWHFRYVGVEAAREIMETGVALEEYLGVTD